jgi:hypothetical protein
VKVCLGFALYLAGGAQLLAQDGDLTLYVFDRGSPVEAVEILIDDELVSWTQANGVAVLAIGPGIHELELRYQDHVVLEQQIIITQDEVAQWIVDISGGGSALYDVESSHLDAIAEQAVIGEEEPGGVPGTVAGVLTTQLDVIPFLKNVSLSI